jgi:maleate isomerase
MALPYTVRLERPKQIGLIVLQSDETLERDMRRLLPQDVECLVSRVPSATTVTPENLHAMEPELTKAASLLPRGAQCLAVGYGCTSAAAHIGPARIATRIQAGVDTPTVTEPVSALIAACRHLGVRRLGLISPYIASVSDRLRSVLQDAKIEVTHFASFEEPVEERVVRIAPQSVEHAALEIGRRTDCDAIFLSCTNLRTLDVIASVEAKIGKPVFSSNQVLAWHLGLLGGFASGDAEFGQLFTQSEQLPADAGSII